MTTYGDSTSTMNALMDLAERPAPPRHPGWKPNLLELAMGEPFIWAPCDDCGALADIVHLGIVPSDTATDWATVRFCADCVQADCDAE